MTERAEEILDHIDRIENKKIDDLYFSYLSNKEKMRVDPALTLLQNKAKLDAINEQFSLFNKAILSASKVVSDSALLKINIEKRQQIIERFTIESELLYNNLLINEKIGEIRIILESVRGASMLPLIISRR